MGNIKIYLESSSNMRLKGTYRVIHGLTKNYARKKKCGPIKVMTKDDNTQTTIEADILCPNEHRNGVINEIHMVLLSMVKLIPSEKYDIHYKF